MVEPTWVVTSAENFQFKQTLKSTYLEQAVPRKKFKMNQTFLQSYSLLPQNFLQ